MEFHTAQSLYRIHGVSSIPTDRRSWVCRLHLALASLSRATAEVRRAERGHGCLLGMTKYQLRDIGHRRIESRAGGQIAPLGDAGE